jgi:photosystem II stability/assembly factor-like uncharacterized protein
MRLAALGLALSGIAAPAAAVGSAAPVDVAELPSEPARLASRALLLDVANAGQRLVAVGERGHVLLSDDAGRHWSQVQTPTQSLLTAVCFADAAHGIAVGHDEIILATADGGRSWKRTHFAPQAQQPLLDVWCGSDGDALAVGAYGVYMVSQDYGASWAERKLQTANGSNRDEMGGGYHLNAIAADASSRLYIAAEAGHLYRSEDRGATWVSLSFPYAGSLFGVLPLADGAVLAFGLRGNLFRSADGGDTWKRIATGTQATLDGGTSLEGGRVAIVGLSGVVLLSRDGGSSFTLLQQDDRKGLAAVRGVAGNELVTVGEAGVKLIAGPTS